MSASRDSLFDLSGKTVLVTGANAGIGFGYADALARAGAGLVIWGRRADRNEEAAEKLRAHGGKVFSQIVDIADERRVIDAFAEAVAETGAVHAVFANAGITVGHLKLPELTTDVLMQAIAVNQLGTVYTCREAAKHMIARGKGGSIVLTGSTSSLIGFAHGNLAYSMTKGALLSGTRTMAAELGQYGIRVNCIVPGAVESELAYPQAIADALRAKTPVGRPGRQNDVGGLAVYLASDASAYQSGAAIVLDGGHSILA